MNWLELHFDNGTPVLVKISNITSINKDCSDETNDTIISFCGNQDNYIIVSETYDDIRKLLS